MGIYLWLAITIPNWLFWEKIKADHIQEILKYRSKYIIT